MAKKQHTGLSPEEETDFVRRYRLVSAWGADDPVEVDGVSIDLRCDLDAQEWRPVAGLGIYSHEGVRWGPRIAFPWTPEWVLEKWGDTPEVIAAPLGSRIKIATMHDAPLRATFGEFELPEHTERKAAYLWVYQAGGDLKLVEPPLQFVRTTATTIQIELDNYGGAYRGLVTKLERLIGCEDLEALLEEPLKNLLKLPDHLSLNYRQALLALHDAIDTANEHSYVAFGYLMARAEAEQQLLESALRDRQAAAHRAKGAKARQSNSRQKTEPLRSCAKTLMVGNASLSLTACAKAVAAVMAENPDWKMKTDPNWIADHIRELFDQREVDGKIEYRPKPEWVHPT